jgi:NitT/TauT family transport system ATP-binding protein
MEPTSGTIVLDGQRVDGPAKGMAVVFQEYGRSLFPWLTVEANVELPLKTAGVPKAERRQRAAEALEAVSLSHETKSYPWQLSGGMQQRVAIARAVASHPSVLLMDEPFAAVDAQTRGELEDLVRDVWKRLNMTILFITHDIDESVYLGERVLVLSSSPTVVQHDLTIDLPVDRDQGVTRALPRFAELREQVYDQVQMAKTNRGGVRAAIVR